MEDHPLLPSRKIQTSSNDFLDEALIPGSPLAQVFQCKRMEDDSDCLIYALLSFEHAIDKDKLIDAVRLKILPLQRFRSTMVRHGQGYAWKELSGFDVSDHVHDVHESGNDTSVDFINLLMQKPMDLSNPLWEIYILRSESISSGDKLLFRLHHSLGDGISLASLMLDIAETREGSSPSLPKPRAKPPGSFLGRIFRVLEYTWSSIVCLTRFTILLLCKDPVRGVKVTGSVRHLPRDIGMVNISLADIKSVARLVGATVNDVVVTVTAMALERYEEQIKSQKESPLRVGSREYRPHALVMVNLRPPLTSSEIDRMRSGENISSWGTIVGYTAQPLPVISRLTPIDRLMAVKKSMDQSKNSVEPLVTNLAMSLVGTLLGPQRLLSLLLYIVNQASIGISNIACTEEELLLFGNPLKSIYQFVTGIPMGLSVHVMGYAGNVNVCISGCTSFVNVPLMAKCISQAFSGLLDELNCDN